MEYADFIQISMFHPPHYHTSVVSFKNYAPFPPLHSPWKKVQCPRRQISYFPTLQRAKGEQGINYATNRQSCSAVQDHIIILFLFAKLDCVGGGHDRRCEEAKENYWQIGNIIWNGKQMIIFSRVYSATCSGGKSDKWSIVEVRIVKMR